MCIDAVLLGEVPCDEVVTRGGARPGDLLAVTGTLGGRAARRLAATRDRQWLGAEHAPRPRLEAGRALARGHLAHAMLDISDGLASDAGHLARASDVGLEIDLAAVPIDPDAVRLSPGLRAAAVELALGGGEDYELLVALAPEHVELARAAVRDTTLTVVGTVVEARYGMVLVEENGNRRPLPEIGWRHF